MTAVEQLGLSLDGPLPVPDVPTSKQHRKVLVALYEARSRGLTGEECATACGIRLAATATTRLEELAERGLVWKSTHKHRATASGRLAHTWHLNEEGVEIAKRLAEEA